MSINVTDNFIQEVLFDVGPVAAHIEKVEGAWSFPWIVFSGNRKLCSEALEGIIQNCIDYKIPFRSTFVGSGRGALVIGEKQAVESDEEYDYRPF